MKYTRRALAHTLQCCERTIHRATMNGDLMPCAAVPPTYDEKDVIEFLNSCRKGGAPAISKLPDDFVNTASLAEAVAVSPGTVRRWYRACDTNSMPHYRMSQTWVLFSVSAISEWIKRQADSAERARTRRNELKQKARSAYKKLASARKGSK